MTTVMKPPVREQPKTASKAKVAQPPLQEEVKLPSWLDFKELTAHLPVSLLQPRAPRPTPPKDQFVSGNNPKKPTVFLKTAAPAVPEGDDDDDKKKKKKNKTKSGEKKKKQRFTDDEPSYDHDDA